MDIKKKKDKYRNIAELKFEQIASLMSWLFSLSLGFIIYLNVKKNRYFTSLSSRNSYVYRGNWINGEKNVLFLASVSHQIMCGIWIMMSIQVTDFD